MEELIKTLDRQIGQLYLLKSKSNYFHSELMFNFNNKTYLWIGDYSIEDAEVTIEQTNSFSCIQDQSEVEFTDLLKSIVKLEILNNE